MLKVAEQARLASECWDLPVSASLAVALHMHTTLSGCFNPGTELDSGPCAQIALYHLSYFRETDFLNL